MPNDSVKFVVRIQPVHHSCVSFGNYIKLSLIYAFMPNDSILDTCWKKSTWKQNNNLAKVVTHVRRIFGASEKVFFLG